MNEPTPHDIVAEENVLGAMMISASAIEKVLPPLLEVDSFYRRSHGLIFQAACDRYVDGKLVDPVTLVAELDRRGHLEEAGGEGRIKELSILMPVAGNIAHYAEIVREKWFLRRMQRIGLSVNEMALSRPGEIPDMLDSVEEMLADLRTKVEKGREVVVSGLELAQRYEAKIKNPEDETLGIPTPFSWLSPMRGGRLYVLGGYQADGKSALALQFLRSACESGAKVGFASIEMSAEDLTDRLVATFGVPYHQARTGQISEHHQADVEAALRSIATWKFDVIDDEAISPASLRRYQRLGGYDLLIVDHLHRMDWSERRELEKAVRSITNMTREFDIPILLLAQLSRAGDWRDPYPRPTMSRLRESGMIEAEASAVWFIWRKRDDFQQPTTVSEFIVAKNRHGGLGYENLTFVPNQVRFEPRGILP